MKNYKEYLNEKNPKVLIKTNRGDMEVELFPNVAPITVKNFLNLVENHFYDGLIFHRVIQDFMIQGGDPLGTGYGGSKKKIKGEFKINGVSNELSHTRGVISMARSMDNNSASSQFFIMHSDGTYLDGSYAAFGALISGFETLDSIATTKTSFGDKPVYDVIIEKINIL